MNWHYLLKCLSCKKEYEANPETITIGNIDDGEKVPTEIVDGIQLYKVEPTYTGRVTKVYCPSCCLRAFAPENIPLIEFNSWNEASDYDFSNFYHAGNGELELNRFPVNCPKCSTSINKENMRKLCKFCGSSQVNILESKPNKNSQQDAANDAAPLL